LLAVKAELADYVVAVVVVVAAVFPEQVVAVAQVAVATAWLSAGNSISSNAEIDLS
jgi:asparagine N-glycosylation enzyme membrane subunit Stt3